MIKDITGLHHVTSMAADANENNAFFTHTLGLRRVKKTVNFDAPDVYHLYYGDEVGTPGSVMTYFPIPGLNKGRRGAGEVGVTEFAVPMGSLPYWSERLAALGVTGLAEGTAFGEARLDFDGPDGDGFALVESEARGRTPWTGNGVPEDAGLLGFRGARFRLRDSAATGELLTYMGYQKAESVGDLTRYVIEGGNAADIIDLEEISGAPSFAIRETRRVCVEVRTADVRAWRSPVRPRRVRRARQASSRWTVSGEKAGRQMAMYSAPSSSGVL